MKKKYFINVAFVLLTIMFAIMLTINICLISESSLGESICEILSLIGGYILTIIIYNWIFQSIIEIRLTDDVVELRTLRGKIIIKKVESITKVSHWGAGYLVRCNDKKLHTYDAFGVVKVYMGQNVHEGIQKNDFPKAEYNL